MGNAFVVVDSQMENEIAAIVPTLGRPSLKAALESLDAQVVRPIRIIVKPGPGTAIDKFNEALHEVSSEYVALLDDDGWYPSDFLLNLRTAILSDPKIGFAAGSVRPMTEIEKNPTRTQRCIATVTSSWAGTTNMSQRIAKGQALEDRDETNMPGVGLWRRAPLMEIYKNAGKDIPHAFHDTYQIFKLNQMGWRTVYVPDGFFYHAVKPTLEGFCKQMYRSGTGRMNFFKLFPREALRKGYILAPAIFLLYLATLPFSLLFTPLVVYLAIVLLASAKDLLRLPMLPLFFISMHLSYGAGLLAGLFVHKRNWA